MTDNVKAERGRSATNSRLIVTCRAACDADNGLETSLEQLLTATSHRRHRLA